MNYFVQYCVVQWVQPSYSESLTPPLPFLLHTLLEWVWENEADTRICSTIVPLALSYCDAISDVERGSSRYVESSISLVGDLLSFLSSLLSFLSSHRNALFSPPDWLSLVYPITDPFSWCLLFFVSFVSGLNEWLSFLIFEKFFISLISQSSYHF